MINIIDMNKFCKKKGFVYPSAEIYGGLSGTYDYSFLGVELKNNIKQSWWKEFVSKRRDLVGIDGSILTNPKVLKASGHVDNFDDPMVECNKCKAELRVDTLIEEVTGINIEGKSEQEMDKVILEKGIKCPTCKGDLGKVHKFNLMFETNVGPVKGNKAYLRPETAQSIFTNFRLVQEHARLKLPFGIAQIGKSFRNEISPRDFLFRVREFEQLEIEYFIDPNNYNCPYIKKVENIELTLFDQDCQNNNKESKVMKVRDALKKKIILTEWHAYFMAIYKKWFLSLGINSEHIRFRQHLEDEKSHYSSDTWDMEYKFPSGWKELQGFANRTDFDLKQHQEHSKTKMEIFQDDKKFIPHVVCEPSLGLERTFLIFMFDAYNDDKKRGNIVLKLHPKLAPYKVAVFPLMKNKPEIMIKTEEVYELLSENFETFYDVSGSIGRRYARQDEVGTPYCVTIDFDSLEDGSVTVRDRDTTEQKRIKITELVEYIENSMKNYKVN